MSKPDSQTSNLREYRVVQTTTWYVRASDAEDAQDRVSDGMGDLAGTTYRVAVLPKPKF